MHREASGRGSRADCRCAFHFRAILRRSKLLCFLWRDCIHGERSRLGCGHHIHLSARAICVGQNHCCGRSHCRSHRDWPVLGGWWRNRPADDGIRRCRRKALLSNLCVQVLVASGGTVSCGGSSSSQISPVGSFTLTLTAQTASLQAIQSGLHLNRPAMDCRPSSQQRWGRSHSEQRSTEVSGVIGHISDDSPCEFAASSDFKPTFERGHEPQRTYKPMTNKKLPTDKTRRLRGAFEDGASASM